jgi:hypothetical protein
MVLSTLSNEELVEQFGIFIAKMTTQLLALAAQQQQNRRVRRLSKTSNQATVNLQKLAQASSATDKARYQEFVDEFQVRMKSPTLQSSI